MDNHEKRHIIEASLGSAAGIATGLSKNHHALHLHGIGNVCSKFFHHASRSLSKNHKGASSIGGALVAGTMAVAGPTVGAAVVAAAPVLIAGAALAGTSYGVFKLAMFAKGRSEQQQAKKLNQRKNQENLGRVAVIKP